MKDAMTYAHEAGFFSFNVVGWKIEFERLIASIRAEYEAPLKLAEEALNAMLTHMGMDEDEWTKPTFNQAREALAAIREASADHVANVGKMVAEPVKQEPVAHYKDAPHTIYLQTGCDDPEDCDCSFNEWGDTTWCADQIHDTDIPYIRADYAAPVSAPKQEDQEPVERPQNCGTSYCSCIECIYGKDGCVADEEQCNDGCLARESVIANAFKLADEIDAEFFQGRISNHNGRKAAQMLRMLIEAPVQPVKQKPAAFVSDIESGRPLMCDLDEWHQKGLTALYAAPVDAKAIRAEAL